MLPSRTKSSERKGERERQTEGVTIDTHHQRILIQSLEQKSRIRRRVPKRVRNVLNITASCHGIFPSHLFHMKLEPRWNWGTADAAKPHKKIRLSDNYSFILIIISAIEFPCSARCITKSSLFGNESAGSVNQMFSFRHQTFSGCFFFLVEKGGTFVVN